jgi:hypothetical protein
LEQARRNTKYQETDLASAFLTRPLTLPELKQRWLEAADNAEKLLAQLPVAEAGCLYLDSAASPITPDPTSPAFPGLVRHHGSVRGAWPKLD